MIVSLIPLVLLFRLFVDVVVCCLDEVVCRFPVGFRLCCVCFFARASVLVLGWPVNVVVILCLSHVLWWLWAMLVLS